MKTLVNCTPTEFMKQTYKIKEAVSKWLADTDIINIRKRMPDGLKKVMDGETDEIRKDLLAGNKKLIEEQARKNISAMLDAIMVDYPQETLEILALVCFIEPEDVDKHTMREYLLALNEILSDEAVIGFFISLARLGAMNTPNASTI